MFRLIAVDLDGTLLNSNLQIPPLALQMLRLVRRQGVHVAVVTGRMACSALPLAREVYADFPLIAYNGAMVVDVATAERLFHQPLPASAAAEVLDLARQRGIHVNAYIDDRLYVERVEPWGRLYAERTGAELNVIDSVASLPADNLTKFILLDTPEAVSALAEELPERFAGRLRMMKSLAEYLEVIHPEVGKATALAKICSRAHIPPAQVMAFGDNQNDAEMLHWAGCGVAMANADADVQAAADMVAPSNDEDGIGQVLRRMYADGEI